MDGHEMLFCGALKAPLYIYTNARFNASLAMGLSDVMGGALALWPCIICASVRETGRKTRAASALDTTHTWAILMRGYASVERTCRVHKPCHSSIEPASGNRLVAHADPSTAFE